MLLQSSSNHATEILEKPSLEIHPYLFDRASFEETAQESDK